MLYKINSPDNNDARQLEPMPFTSIGELGLKEKGLENLISNNLFEVLFSESPLMPIFQERPFQKEGDIYALDENGDLTIFELKRDIASDGAILQLLTYAQLAGSWNYSTLDDKFRKYLRNNNEKDKSLEAAHQETFKVELTHEQFNRRQHLIVIGNAADKELINCVQYWNQQGLSISFAPYRIYVFNGEKCFEFFTPPYDQHADPSMRKGVIVDTNETWKIEGISDIWYMMENSRIAAFGDRKKVIDWINQEDIVFFYQKGYGVVAAGIVKSDRKEDNIPEEDRWYRDVEFLTTPPKKIPGVQLCMPAKTVKEVSRRGFYWASTIKRPYLSIDEAENLVNELNKYLNK